MIRIIDFNEHLHFIETQDNIQHYVKCGGGEINIFNGKIRNGASIEIKSIPLGVLQSQEEFFCCVKCGKVFWEGSHWDRYLGKRNKLHEPR